MHVTHADFILKVQTGIGSCVWLAQLRSAHTLADKMAALRVAVASGSGRALLNTPRTIKTPAVGGRMSSVFVFITGVG